MFRGDVEPQEDTKKKTLPITVVLPTKNGSMVKLNDQEYIVIIKENRKKKIIRQFYNH